MLRYEIPQRVIFNNGPQFVGTVMQQASYCLSFNQFNPDLSFGSKLCRKEKQRHEGSTINPRKFSRQMGRQTTFEVVRYAMNTSTPSETYRLSLCS